MKNLFLAFCLGASFSSMAQYSAIPKEELRWENYSVHEIRQALINTQPRDSEIYDLARRSRANRNASYALFALSGLKLLSGAHALNSEGSNSSENSLQLDMASVAPYAIGLGVLELGLGLWLNHQSRSKLKRALRLYHK